MKKILILNIKDWKNLENGHGFGCEQSIFWGVGNGNGGGGGTGLGFGAGHNRYTYGGGDCYGHSWDWNNPE